MLIGMLKNTPTSDTREPADDRKLDYQNQIFSNGGIIQTISFRNKTHKRN